MHTVCAITLIAFSCKFDQLTSSTCVESMFVVFFLVIHTGAHVMNAINFSRHYSYLYPEINAAKYKGEVGMVTGKENRDFSEFQFQKESLILERLVIPARFQILSDSVLTNLKNCVFILIQLQAGLSSHSSGSCRTGLRP